MVKFSITQLIMGYMVMYLNPLNIIIFVCYFLNYKYYFLIEDKETSHRILKKLGKYVITFCSKISHGKQQLTGVFIGRNCIGYIDNYSYDDTKIYILTSPTFYESLIENLDSSIVMIQELVLPKIENTKIEVLMRSGAYKNIYYRSQRLDLSHLNAIDDQKYIVDDIIELYKNQGRATIFIDGVSHAGKSSIGYIVAKNLGGKYCHTFNPTDPGDQLNILISDANIEDSPLIIVLEEVDILLDNIHNNTIKPNKEIPIIVHNKSTWTSFLDDMFFYRKVILIMTSNKVKSEIDKMDISYLRKGRIHANFSMPNKLNIYDS
jgi:hypothetical protein